MKYWLGLFLIGISIAYSVFYAFFKKYPFVNIRKIITKYKEIFNKSNSDLYAFILIPLFAAIGVTLSFSINTPIVELICTTVSILLGLLFATLGVLASITPPSIDQESVKRSGASREKITQYRTVYNQTVQLILYLGLLSITELVCVFAAIIASSNYYKIPDELYYSMKISGSIIIYYLAFSILLNCLIVLKRISIIIQKRDS